MRKITLAFVLSVLSLLSVSANAAGQKGGICISNSFTGADSVFNCEHIGQATVKQIYSNGWRVVTTNHSPELPGTLILIIEEQKNNS